MTTSSAATLQELHDPINLFKKRPMPNHENNAPPSARGWVRLEIYGKEMVEKVVKMSGNGGRIYLPLEWVAGWKSSVRIEGYLSAMRGRTRLRKWIYLNLFPHIFHGIGLNRLTPGQGGKTWYG